ncbi:ABC transporter permease [Oleiphilus sp. HI0071]|jgi:putative ABC transport system substrate-binding protein|nr:MULTISPECIES: ABC transporter substrate-binding protein [unclassified Oleiphilus]KZY63749.1 ABC transporter permease [Oleiphilus sp. HI0065]KZY81926.1 ABC transporter permease [Oleiphilus sp. HI0071]KZY92406.1 ABC transporter permease [Oleiphilus sp. HI0073]KZZ51410.1 ABC transporter permease [Oleiphilus sp. HI0122]KZZ51517.1 ABC transporter permease [Oleiphilus sp. HI0118]KZZ70741.1 ABC transporter permease [Oleiphilus sp. HI0130]KZZ77827.1 ABC transporter permease [Oleiphilus sp. HI0133
MNISKTLALACAFLAVVMSGHASAEEKHVSITQIVEHPALDSVRQGVKDVLAEAGYREGENLKWEYQSAQGNPTTAAQIAKKFAGSNPDVIVAIATPSAQAMVASARSSNIIFSAVTDPVGAKLVKAWDKPSPRVSGVSDLTPVDKHMALVKEIVPSAKKLGVIYNPGEANSVSLVELVKKHAPEQGLDVVEAASPKSADVQTAMRSLVGKVDAIYLPTDNTVISALEGVLKIAEQTDIPVIAADTDSVKRGAIAALGFNYYDVGRQTGAMVVEVLNGKAPGDLPVQGVDKTELYLNPGAAAAMGIELPASLTKRAKEIIQ